MRFRQPLVNYQFYSIDLNDIRTNHSIRTCKMPKRTKDWLDLVTNLEFVDSIQSVGYEVVK